MSDILPGLYLREYAQTAPNDPVRVEVIEVTARSQAAVPVAPIDDAAIGAGTGAWTADELLAKVSAVVGAPVQFWPKPAPPVVEGPVVTVAEGPVVADGAPPLMEGL